MRGRVGDYVFDLELLDGQQQTRLVGKVGVVARAVVGIIGEAVTLLDPHRLLGQLLRRLQIVGIKLLGNDIVVRIQRRGSRPGFGSLSA